jgi:hypothetical protein
VNSELLFYESKCLKYHHFALLLHSSAKNLKGCCIHLLTMMNSKIVAFGEREKIDGFHKGNETKSLRVGNLWGIVYVEEGKKGYLAFCMI